VAAVLTFNPTRPGAARSATPAVLPERLMSSPDSPTISEVIDALRELAARDTVKVRAILFYLDGNLGRRPVDWPCL